MFAACRAVCFALRPDPQNGISSGNECCDQNWYQHNTNKNESESTNSQIFDLFDAQQ